VGVGVGVGTGSNVSFGSGGAEGTSVGGSFSSPVTGLIVSTVILGTAGASSGSLVSGLGIKLGGFGSIGFSTFGATGGVVLSGAGAIALGTAIRSGTTCGTVDFTELGAGATIADGQHETAGAKNIGGQGGVEYAVG